jgi:hypothetical protein
MRSDSLSPQIKYSVPLLLVKLIRKASAGKPEVKQWRNKHKREVKKQRLEGNNKSNANLNNKTANSQKENPR